MLVALIVNVILLFAWAIGIFLWRRGPSLIIFGIGSGIVGTALILLSAYGLWSFFLGVELSEWYLKIIQGPFFEEVAKLLTMLVFFKVIRIIGPDVVLEDLKSFGPSVGLGFAFLENLNFLSNTQNLLLRGLFSWPLHIGTALILSFAIWWLKVRRKSFIWILGFLAISILIHSATNAIWLSLGFH